MINSINHVSFTVENLSKSIEFYSEVYRLELIDVSYRDMKFSQLVTGVENAELKIAYLKCKNIKIELIEYLNSNLKYSVRGSNRIGDAHICFNISDFDIFIEHLKSKKVVFRGEITFITAGPNIGKRVVYTEDIDCNTIEFIEE